MENILLYSNIFLWIFMILQTVVIFLLTKSISEFINRFQLEKKNSSLVSIGNRAPLFREINYNGEWIKLSDFRGKYTLLFFAIFTCGVCKRTLSEIKEDIMKGTNLIHMIIISEEGSQENTAYPTGNNISLIRSEDVLSNYEVIEVPTLFLIDPNGIIVNIYRNDELKQLKKDLGIDGNQSLSTPSKLEYSKI